MNSYIQLQIYANNFNRLSITYLVKQIRITNKVLISKIEKKFLINPLLIGPENEIKHEIL